MALRLIFIFMLLINNLIINGFFNELYFLQGKWILRKSNDPKLKNKYTYFILNPNDEIKIKTISNGFVKTKTSRTGKIKLISIKNNFFKNSFNNNLKNLEEDNNLVFEIDINSSNSYSYSIIGVEVPQIKYKQNTYENLKRKLDIKQKDKTIYVKDLTTNLYYLFDLETQTKKTPYIEISITTLVINELFDLFFSGFFKN